MSFRTAKENLCAIYLYSFQLQPTKPIAVVDLNKPDRVSVIDAIYYTDCHYGHAYLSNYKNIFTAKFDRRADTGEIKLYDIPKRIEGEELLTMLEGLLTRGKDKQPQTDASPQPG